MYISTCSGYFKREHSYNKRKQLGVWTIISNQGSILAEAPCPVRLWGPPSLQANGYRGFFSQGVATVTVISCVNVYLMTC
jgi:hypothetical protein